MVEKVLVTKKVFTFDGLFSLKDIHLQLRKGFLNRGYVLASHQHELIHSEGRNQSITYLFKRDVEDYQTYLIQVDVSAKKIESTTVLDGDKRRELENGALTVTFTGRIHATQEGLIGYRFFESFFRQLHERLFSTKPAPSVALIGDILAVSDELYLILNNLVYEPYEMAFEKEKPAHAKLQTTFRKGESK
jgi:hypothetical protein